MNLTTCKHFMVACSFFCVLKKLNYAIPRYLEYFMSEVKWL
jgi:hypothetical protein